MLQGIRVGVGVGVGVGVAVGATHLFVEQLSQYHEVFPAGHVESVPDRQKFPVVEGDVVHPQSYGAPLIQAEQLLWSGQEGVGVGVMVGVGVGVEVGGGL